MMNKKQKLRNAVILGLLMSSVTASSAWAASLNVNHIIDNNANVTAGNPIYGIWGYKYFAGGTVSYYPYVNKYDSINITVKNNYYLWDDKAGDYAIGISSSQKENVHLNSENDINVNVQTRNALNGYGISSGNENRTVTLNAKGNIIIDVSKTNGVQGPVSPRPPENVNYSKANVYGISTENNGNANLSAGTDIIINAGYDKTAAEKYSGLKQGNIYGISNTGGTVDLTAGNTISITANSANGNAYGIYTDSNEDTNLKGNVNITAVADGTGTAIGIKAENGSKVDIIGDTSVSGDSGAIVIIGKDNAAVPLNGENYFQVTVKGDLTAEAAEGAAITVEKNGSLHVTVDQIINNTFEIKDNSNVVIDGSLVSQDDVIIADNAVNVSGSRLTVGGNVWLNSEKIGMNITENSNVTIEGNGDLGTNYIVGKECGINIDSSTLNITDGDTVLVSEKNALEMNNAKNSVIGSKESTNVFASNTGSAIFGKGYSNLTVNGDYNVISTNSQSVAAVELTDHADVTINGSENYIYGNYDKNGAIHSIKAVDGSKFTMGADSGNNVLYGVVSAENKETKVTLNGSNTIYSSTHGSSEAGREHIVAALFARDNAEINLNAGETGRNVIVSDFEFQEGDKHKDDSERTIWAQQGGKIIINGATDIIASNSGVYTDGIKGNARGIAITAGSEVIPESGIDKDDIIDIDNSFRSTVTLNYSGESLIKGDIVSGYGGLVTVNGGYITENGTQVALNDSAKGSLNMEGNALAANGGKLNLDLGNGGVWYGRADDYGDAGIDTSGNHTKFYNPAFSNEIIEGGTVSVTMHNQSKWVLTGQSWVSTLTANNSIIDMAGAYISDENIDMYDMDHTHALTIGTFDGDGSTFIMDLDAKDLGQSDMLYIKDNQGTFNVQLKDALTDEELNSLGENGLRFATISGNVDENTKVVYAGSGFSNVVYDVKSVNYDFDDENNSIYNDGYEEDITQKAKVEVEDEDKDNNFNHGKPGQDYVDKNFNEEDKNLIITGVAGRQTGGIGQTIVDMSKANYTNAIYMDRLNKRMGETRFIDGDEGMWVRLRHDRIGKEDSFRSMNTMYEMGYDVKQVKEDGEHRVGVAIDYMDGSTSYSKLGGDGEISRKGIWMYDTWVGEKGHYRDFVAKWGHLSNDFDVYAGTGDNVTGDYSNNVYSISAEFGKKNDIGNNWYFEPQAQLQYAHVTGAEYMTSAGTAVNVDDINSLIARAGFRIGKDLGERSTVYFKADLMHEFLGEQDVFAMDKSTGTSGAHERYDHGGTWCDLGFGFATAMSKTSYAYLDVETSLGNDYDETYQINAGLQWTF